jgi:hypothetical protein
VYTQDANSFRASQGQIIASMTRTQQRVRGRDL